jgi:hypothetical protein
VLADDRADHVDRIDTVTGGRRPDLGDQLLVGGQKVADLLVFVIEGVRPARVRRTEAPGTLRLLRRDDFLREPS